MTKLITFPLLAAGLVAASASLTSAFACVPNAGQCCTGAPFTDHGRICRVAHCRGEGQFARVTTQTNCVFTTKPLRGVTVPRPMPSL